MINSEIELILKWSEDCVLAEKATREALTTGNDPAIEPAVNAINILSDLRLVTLQAKYQNQLYKDLKRVISTDFKQSKYR